MRQATWGWQFYQASGTVEYRLGNLGGAEEGVVRQYLATLAVLERAIPEVGASLDTGSVAGWVRNPAELTERGRLFDDWRRRFLRFPRRAAGARVATARLQRDAGGLRWMGRCCRTG